MKRAQTTDEALRHEGARPTHAGKGREAARLRPRAKPTDPATVAPLFPALSRPALTKGAGRGKAKRGFASAEKQGP